MSEEKENVPFGYKSDDELKQIAIDIYDGKIFTDRHIADNAKDNLPMIFMPIALGALSSLTEEEVNDLGLIYEYYSEAGPRCVNGFPSFFSLKMLNKACTVKMNEYYNQYRELKEKFKNETTVQ